MSQILDAPFEPVVDTTRDLSATRRGYINRARAVILTTRARINVASTLLSALVRNFFRSVRTPHSPHLARTYFRRPLFFGTPFGPQPVSGLALGMARKGKALVGMERVRVSPSMIFSNFLEKSTFSKRDLEELKDLR